MTTAPLVSVVIPCFNQAKYLGGAISTIHRQAWPHIESIVIDDRWTDDIRAMGGFPVSDPAAAYYAVMLAFARHGMLVIEPREVACYRKHDTNMSPDPILMLRATLSVLERERRHLPRAYDAVLQES